MNWACALALGMWFSILLDGHLAMLWVCLGLFHLCLPLNLWKRAAAWVAVGWACALLSQEMWAKPVPFSTSGYRWLEIQPSFVPSQAAVDGAQLHRGIWEARDEKGNAFSVWLHASNPLPLEFPCWAWVHLESIAKSDVTSSFQFDDYLTQSGVSKAGEVLKWAEPDSGPAMDHALPSMAAWAQRWRRHIASLFEGDAKGLLLGVFAGDRKAVPHEIRDAFSHLGIGHLLAVSGYHVGLVSSLFLVLLRFQNQHLRRFSVVGVLVGGVFVWICGAPVSGVRSWMMLTLGWWSLVRGRRPDLWGAWGMAACIAVLLDPHTPRNLGAQLSFLATGSLLALGKFTAWWRVPLRAQLATSTLSLPAFGVVPWAFYPVNLAAGPVMMVLGGTFILAILGLPGGVRLAQAFTDGFAELVLTLDRSLPLWSDSRRVAGWTGRVLLLPLSTFWVLRLVPGKRRQLALRSCLSAAAALTGLASGWIHAHHSELRMWQLKGRPGSALITDGYGVLAFGTGESHPAPRNAAVNLVMEGPLDIHTWSKQGDSTNKKWIQPPFQAWIHRNASQMTSEPVPLE